MLKLITGINSDILRRVIPPITFVQYKTKCMCESHTQRVYSKTCLKRPLKRKTKNGFQDRLSLNAGQKYCRMLQGEHSAILSTFIKLPLVVKTFVLPIFEWPLKTGFAVLFRQTKIKNISLKTKTGSHPPDCLLRHFIPRYIPSSISFIISRINFKSDLIHSALIF